MNMHMKNRFWLKLTGLALLLHIVLIIISVLEVVIYSYLIMPGKNEAFYEEHAQITGPWVSGIFGFILVFLIVRWFIKKNTGRYLLFAIAFPLVYILLDVLILLPFNINWMEHLPVLLTANGAKLAGSLLSYMIYKGDQINDGPTSNCLVFF
jgi:hypothetical protein